MSGRADTLAHRCKLAVAFIRSRGDWVALKDIAAFLGLNTEQTSRALGSAVTAGKVERLYHHGGCGGSKLSFRITKKQPAPPKFSIDWPPKFVPQLATIRAATWGDRS